MNISATEFQNNFSKYIAISREEDIVITKRGKPVAVVTKPSNVKSRIVHELIGVLPNSIDVEQEIEDRRSTI